MDALTLAYMGDVVWSLLSGCTHPYGIYQVQILSTLTSEIVSARWQSRILFEIREVLNDRELKVCKRGRNTSSTVPKSATVEEYREATAFEALLGYLKLAGEEERLRFILQKSCEVCGRRIPTCRLKSKAIENRGGKNRRKAGFPSARHREKRPPKRKSSDGVRPVKDDSLMTFGRNSVTEFLRADRVRSVFIKEGRR